MHAQTTYNMQKITHYIELVKPRLTAMALFSGAVGYIAAVDKSRAVNWTEVLHLVTALGLVGAASNIMNQVLEHHLDVKMDRTSGRPIPMGRVSDKEATVIGLLCLIGGSVYLYLVFPLIVVWLALLTFGSYVLVYTPMKTISSLNTVVGALPGALPALTGWVACRGSVDFYGFSLFAIIFVWQLPHFFSIAWIYKKDYQRAGYKMISVYDETGKQAVILSVLGTLALIPISFIPFLTGHTGPIYFIGTFMANTLLFITSLLLIKNREKYMKIYFYGSITWLPFVLTLMMIDRA